MRFRDLTGQKFGRLTVIERGEKTGKAIRWNCICDCGKKCTVQANHLLSGAIKSCGCFHDEAHVTHGLTHTKIYSTWHGMKSRCLNPNAPKYKNHGGRGITICAEWINDFAAFYEYVSKLEHFGEKGYSLDRIDNDGNYEPGNVRWATAKEQNRNMRTNHLVEYNGQMMPLAQAAELSGISIDALRARIRRNGDNYAGLFAPGKEVIRSVKSKGNRPKHGFKAYEDEWQLILQFARMVKKGNRAACEEFIAAQSEPVP